jgi:hypothetical protein
MTTSDPLDALLVVRAWRQPDGPLCARVGSVTDVSLRLEPACWELCVGTDRTLAVVRAWLQRCAAASPVPFDTRA